MATLNFECYLNETPGQSYAPGQSLHPAAGAHQLLDVDVSSIGGLKRALELILRLGRDPNFVSRLGRCLMPGDLIAIWLNPSGAKRFYAIEQDRFRRVDVLEPLSRGVAAPAVETPVGAGGPAHV